MFTCINDIPQLTPVSLKPVKKWKSANFSVCFWRKNSVRRKPTLQKQRGHWLIKKAFSQNSCVSISNMNLASKKCYNICMYKRDWNSSMKERIRKQNVLHGITNFLQIALQWTSKSPSSDHILLHILPHIFQEPSLMVVSPLIGSQG
jgi:hypothetical protein